MTAPWLAIASTALALSSSVGEAAWRKIEYPDFVTRMPQMKGTMLGSTTEKEFNDLRAMGATLVRYQMHADWKQFGGTNEVERYVAWLNGRLANLERLMERIANPSLPPCDIFLPAPLVLRGSTEKRWNHEIHERNLG